MYAYTLLITNKITKDFKDAPSTFIYAEVSSFSKPTDSSEYIFTKIKRTVTLWYVLKYF